MRVALADDSALFRRGVARLLSDEGVDIAGEYPTADELVANIVRDRVDAVILDMRMPPGFNDEGLLAAERLKVAHPQLGVLLLSTYAELAYATRLLQTGHTGVGYLLKDNVADHQFLIQSLVRLTEGDCVVDPSLVTALFSHRRRADDVDRLTEREREIVRLMAEGRSNAGICRELRLSPKTVESHIASVFNKLTLPPAGDDNRRVLVVLRWLRYGRGEH